MRYTPKFPIGSENDLKLFWKIASLEKTSRKMWGNRHHKGFSWVDWYALEEDIAELYTQTSQAQARIKKLVNRLKSN
jgi:elongation factor P--beta-lysine ligase